MFQALQAPSSEGLPGLRQWLPSDALLGRGWWVHAEKEGGAAVGAEEPDWDSPFLFAEFLALLILNSLLLW